MSFHELDTNNGVKHALGFCGLGVRALSSLTTRLHS